VSEFASVYVVTFLIGVGGLHHSIATTVEIFAAVPMSAELTPTSALWSVEKASLGNLTGGSRFVAMLNCRHIRNSRAVEEN
jgi:formate/nitrite transporter FocA (FNT family)